MTRIQIPTPLRSAALTSIIHAPNKGVFHRLSLHRIQIPASTNSKRQPREIIISSTTHRHTDTPTYTDIHRHTHTPFALSLSTLLQGLKTYLNWSPSRVLRAFCLSSAVANEMYATSPSFAFLTRANACTSSNQTSIHEQRKKNTNKTP